MKKKYVRGFVVWNQTSLRVKLTKEGHDNFYTFCKGLQIETTLAFENSIWNYLEHKISKKVSESNRLRTEDLKNLIIETDGYAIASKKRKMMLSQQLRQSTRLNYKNIVRNFFRCKFNLQDQTTHRTSPQTTKRTQNNKEMWHITVTEAIAMCREISDSTTFHIQCRSDPT